MPEAVIDCVKERKEDERREREREREREKDKENYQLINSGWRMGNGGRGTAVHGRPKIDKEGGNNHISDGGREQGKKRTKAPSPSLLNQS